METKTRILIVGAILAVVLAVQSGGALPLPGPLPSPLPRPEGPELLAVFQSAPQGQGKDDAVRFAALCRAIEQRLTKERTLPEEKRRLTTGVRIDDFRLQVRIDYMDALSFNVRYPGLKLILADWFDGQVGKSGGKVDDAQLDKWIGAFKKLADSAEYASGQL
jgi:hypothetical protein